MVQTALLPTVQEVLECKEEHITFFCWRQTSASLDIYSKSPFIRTTFEIEWTMRSGMVLFLTSEVLSSLFLAHIQPVNPYSPIQQMSSRSNILELLSEHSLSR
jgi:hypothetical protein